MSFTNLQVDLADLPMAQAIVFEPLKRRHILTQTALMGGFVLILAAVATVVTFMLLPESWRPALLALLLLPALPLLTYLSCNSWLCAAGTGHSIAQRRFLAAPGDSTLVRIQHIELARGPIDKRLELAGLRIFSAGTGTETMTIPGLNLATAQSIRSRLLDAQDLQGQL